MKKIFLLTISFMLFSNIIFAQESNRDVVYLKNGSVIKGHIIEQVPNKTITIQTIDGSTFVYPIEEIKKMRKETNSNKTNNTKRKGKNNNRFNYYSFNIGATYNSTIGFGLSLNLVELNIAKDNGWGGTLKWGSSAGTINVPTYNNNYYGYDTNSSVGIGLGYLLAGPSYSLQKNNIINTVRFLAGIGVFTAVSDYSQAMGGTNFALGLGSTTRLFTNSRWNMTLGTDIIYCEEIFINLNVGFAYSW